VLRGFRERASGPSPPPRSAGEIVRRARELPSDPRAREAATREPRELVRSWRRETSEETARPEVRTEARRTETRDRIGRERDPIAPLSPAAERRSTVSRSPGRSDVGVSRSPGTGTRARETRTESRGRAERSESGTSGRSIRERSSPSPSSSSRRTEGGSAQRSRGSDSRGSSQARSARQRSP
jgi:hypothetical protein